MQVQKRNGQIVDFDINRIINAIESAMKETEIGIDHKLSKRIANKIEKKVEEKQVVTVEEIQDEIEMELMSSNRKDVAKRFILYRSERSKVRHNPWIMDELQKAIWNNKYEYEKEGFDNFIERVAGSNEKIKKHIVHKKFVPAGRILANRGLHKLGKKVTYSNCYVITPPEDTIESIFDTAKKLARTYSFGGGCGLDVSKLAPRGAKINNAAKETTGAVSFMDLYSLVTELIGQSGRRGALMISIDCSHPDLQEFIDVKNDLTKVTKANISIRVTDEFMKAVKEDKEFDLEFVREETGETIRKTINARDIFYKLAKSNWKMAEPGILYWSRIKGWNLLSNDKEFEYAGVNPCFTGDMKLLTVDGYKTFEELDGQEVSVVNVDGDISQGKVWCSGEKETIELKLANKQTIKCTPNHVFMLNNGDECEAKDVVGKRILAYYGKPNKEEDLFVKLGFIQGDGSLGRINSESHLGLEIHIRQKDKEVFGLFGITPVENKRTYYINGFNDILIQYGFDGSQLPERVFPITYTQWTQQQKANFLKGCYTANGSVIKKHRVAYKTTSKVFALQLQKALLEFGINAYITTNKSKNVKFKNGEYICKESYDINISRLNDIIIFYQKIGFVQKYKMDDLVELIKIKSPKVISIKKLGVKKVYDFSEPIKHWGVVEGLIAHNCAEEPLPAGGSCLLGSINLSEFVKNPFTKQAYFDFESFNETVKDAVVYLNEVLDEGLPLHPLQEQRDSVADYRQIGLGVMGVADLLIKLGVRYGNKESLEICDKIGFAMINSALQQSALLAKEFGAYPKYKKQEVMSSEFFQYNANEETKQLVEKYGLRNSQLTTIAPTGSISTMLGISGGIEPLYSISYTRKTESLHDEETYYKVFTPIAKEYMEMHNIEQEEDLPDFFVTAMTLDYRERIDMQAVWQSHIDASISSTVNVPKEFTIQQVFDLYVYGHEKGLKGVTIFRDGCERAGILTTETKEEKCPECNGVIKNTGGCKECQDCGWSACSL